MLLVHLLHDSLQSRSLPVDAIPPLWRAVRHLADSPFTSTLQRQRLHITLARVAAMSYWLKHSQRYPTQPAEDAEQARKEIAELVDSPPSPDDINAAQPTQPFKADNPQPAFSAAAAESSVRVKSGASAWVLSALSSFTITTPATVSAPPERKGDPSTAGTGTASPRC